MIETVARIAATILRFANVYWLAFRPEELQRELYRLSSESPFIQQTDLGSIKVK